MHFNALGVLNGAVCEQTCPFQVSGLREFGSVSEADGRS
jgi:hypothetical protein